MIVSNTSTKHYVLADNSDNVISIIKAPKGDFDITGKVNQSLAEHYDQEIGDIQCFKFSNKHFTYSFEVIIGEESESFEEIFTLTPTAIY